VNILNKQLQIADKGWSLTWDLGKGLTTLHHKKTPFYEMLHKDSDFFKQPRKWKRMDLREIG
jgi:hypothetical protein